MNNHHLPDSGIDTQIAILRGELQALRNEYQYSAKSQGERLGQFELRQATQEREINRLNTELRVTIARLTTLGGIITIALGLIQFWIGLHRG